MPNVEYFARRPVRINGVDYAPNDPVIDTTLKAHKISAMLSTGRLGQRIKAEDGSTERVNLPVSDMSRAMRPAAPKTAPPEALTEKPAATTAGPGYEAMWRKVWEAGDTEAMTFRQFAMQVCADMKLSTRGNLKDILKRLQNNNIEPAPAD